MGVLRCRFREGAWGEVLEWRLAGRLVEAGGEGARGEGGGWLAFFLDFEPLGMGLAVLLFFAFWRGAVSVAKSSVPSSRSLPTGPSDFLGFLLWTAFFPLRFVFAVPGSATSSLPPLSTSLLASSSLTPFVLICTLSTTALVRPPTVTKDIFAPLGISCSAPFFPFVQR